MNAISLCSGGGLVDVAFTILGLPLVAAVEIDAAIAGVYAANHGSDHLRVESITDTDFSTFPAHTVGWASPSCKNFSQAKEHGHESADDTAVATAISRYLCTCTPAVFVLENVRGYRKSAGLLRIVHTLLALDYSVDIQVVNAANFGVAQTRERLILRARREGGMPPLPAPVPWVGWYAAIADLVDTLPPSAFAPWQLARLPVELTEHGLFDMGNAGRTGYSERNMPLILRPPAQPAPTIATAAPPRAFLINGANAGRDLSILPAEVPAFTVSAQPANKHPERAFLVDSQESNTPRSSERPAFAVPASVAKGPPRVGLSHGRVVKMTPRALARFQSVPDSYLLPSHVGLACCVIGNGVPVLLAQAVIAGLLPSS